MNSIAISDKFYILASPMYILNDFQNEYEDLLGGEIELNYMIIPNKLQIGVFTRVLDNCKSSTESYRLLARFFL